MKQLKSANSVPKQLNGGRAATIEVEMRTRHSWRGSSAIISMLRAWFWLAQNGQNWLRRYILPKSSSRQTRWNQCASIWVQVGSFFPVAIFFENALYTIRKLFSRLQRRTIVQKHQDARILRVRRGVSTIISLNPLGVWKQSDPLGTSASCSYCRRECARNNSPALVLKFQEGKFNLKHTTKSSTQNVYSCVCIYRPYAFDQLFQLD